MQALSKLHLPPASEACARLCWSEASDQAPLLAPDPHDRRPLQIRQGRSPPGGNGLAPRSRLALWIEHLAQHRRRAGSTAPAPAGQRVSCRPCGRSRAARIARQRKSTAGRANDSVGVAEQPSGPVLNQDSPPVAAGATVPDHPLAARKGCEGRDRPPYFFPPRPNRDISGSADPVSPGPRQRRSCRSCPRS
jgi:hypothetical protein